MLLADAEKLALELMREFGLISSGNDAIATQALSGSDYFSCNDWHFEFDDAVRRFGACHWRTHKITLSRELILRNSREQVEDTIRHEIAHALCKKPVRVRGVKSDYHGEEWKRMCKRTGAKPERCYDHEDVDAPKGDWRAICRGCGTVHEKFRRPKRDMWCAHKECTRNHGHRSPIQLLAWRHKNALPDPSEALRKKAVEAMKARLREQEPESCAASNPSMPTEPELTFQCAKCDRQSISFHVTCPVCQGDMMPESKLRAEKEQLKKRIAELERKQNAKR